jgi:hypothetical protein
MTNVEFENVEVRQMDIDPDLAKKMLATNVSNRNIRAAHVDGLKRDMRKGSWRYTGDPIRVSWPTEEYPDGILLDGQHRLSAIVESGTTQKMIVVSGLDPKSKVVMDTGVRRTVGDQLEMDGHHWGNRLAAASRLVLAIETGTLTQGIVKATASEISAFYFANSGILDAVLAVDGINRNVPALSPSHAAAVFFYGSRLYPEQTQAFFERLRTGVNMNATDPALLLRQRLFTDQAITRNQRLWIILRALAMDLYNINTHTKIQLPRGVRIDMQQISDEVSKIVTPQEDIVRG